MYVLYVEILPSIFMLILSIRQFWNKKPGKKTGKIFTFLFLSLISFTRSMIRIRCNKFTSGSVKNTRSGSAILLHIFVNWQTYTADFLKNFIHFNTQRYFKAKSFSVAKKWVICDYVGRYRYLSGRYQYHRFMVQVCLVHVCFVQVTILKLVWLRVLCVQAVPDQVGDPGERECGWQRVVATPLHEHRQEAPLPFRRRRLGVGCLIYLHIFYVLVKYIFFSFLTRLCLHLY